MITGRLYDEATVLRVALAYERATKWHTMNPDLVETQNVERNHKGHEAFINSRFRDLPSEVHFSMVAVLT